MRTFLLVLVAIVFFGCNSETAVKEKDNPVPPAETKSIPDCSNAVKFINDYVQFINSPKKETDISAWIQRNPLLTARFKLAYKKLVGAALKADPEMGLDADPILDAQDFPDKGFELIHCDSTSGYVTLQGKDWKDFLLTLKVVDQNNTWLVDGAGVINIPADKKAKR